MEAKKKKKETHTQHTRSHAKRVVRGLLCVFPTLLNQLHQWNRAKSKDSTIYMDRCCACVHVCVWESVYSIRFRSHTATVYNRPFCCVLSPLFAHAGIMHPCSALPFSVEKWALPHQLSSRKIFWSFVYFPVLFLHCAPPSGCAFVIGVDKTQVKLFAEEA